MIFLLFSKSFNDYNDIFVSIVHKLKDMIGQYHNFQPPFSII